MDDIAWGQWIVQAIIICLNNTETRLLHIHLHISEQWRYNEFLQQNDWKEKVVNGLSHVLQTVLRRNTFASPVWLYRAHLWTVMLATLAPSCSIIDALRFPLCYLSLIYWAWLAHTSSSLLLPPFLFLSLCLIHLNNYREVVDFAFWYHFA